MACCPLLVVLLLCASVAAGQDDKIKRGHEPDCSLADNYTVDSQYKKNLDKLLAALPAAAGANGWFYEGSAGEEGVDQVFGLIMCYADYEATACLDCLSRAPASIATVCPGSRNVRAMYDECVLRYSATPIPATADLSILYYHPVSVPITLPWVPLTSKEVPAAWEPLMGKLTGGVASSLLRLANSSTPYNSSSQEMYGLAQCTRDLNASECSTCIATYANKLGPLFPANNTGGTIKGYSCYLRYQVGALEITLPPPPSPQQQPSGPSSKTGLIISFSIGAASIIVIVILASLILWLRRLQQQKRANKILDEAREQQELQGGNFFGNDPDMEDEFEKGTGPKRFRYRELAIATDNFSETNKLGEGGFGSVYRGFLQEMNLDVAIKRVSKGSRQGRKEYASEVRIISRLRHRNLVQLIGWCHDGGELLLVYELMPNGSLDKHLYSANNILSWPIRHKIVLEVASAILYLHQEWEQCVLHRDIKPSNVMLDASFNAKLGDFGLARLVDHGRVSHATAPAGTLGYMDPQCRASIQSDVYSFGVLLLEVACGRSPAVVLDDDAVIHLSWHVSELHEQGRALDAADPRLDGEFDARQMESVLVAGLWCTQDDRTLRRPSIRQVAGVLRFELPLPRLPTRNPAASYRAPDGLVNTGSSSDLGTNSVMSSC